VPRAGAEATPLKPDEKAARTQGQVRELRMQVAQLSGKNSALTARLSEMSAESAAGTSRAEARAEAAEARLADAQARAASVEAALAAAKSSVAKSEALQQQVDALRASAGDTVSAQATTVTELATKYAQEKEALVRLNETSAEKITELKSARDVAWAALDHRLDRSQLSFFEYSFRVADSDSDGLLRVPHEVGLALDKLGRGREIAVVLSRMAVVTTVSSPARRRSLLHRPANTSRLCPL